MQFLKRHGFIILFIVGIVVILLCAEFYSYVENPVDSEERVLEIEITRGTSFSAIVDLLGKGGLITRKTFFLLLAHAKRATNNIKAGEYELNSSMSPRQIIDILKEGRVKRYRVSIPEGFTVSQIASRLAAKKIVDKEKFVALAHDQEFLASLKIDGVSAEGYLFPDTYVFSRFMGERKVIEFMVDHFWRIITPDMEERAKELGFTLNEIVILASIVEKEGGIKDEKPLIAAVFHNRLKRGMRLQSDPTVIYDIEDFDGNLKRSHLEQNTPYNTYQIKGLPPGPICNPGLDAIMAVICPDPADYLYFVSKNDGSHQFSSNLASHNKAVITYQINRKK